MRKTLWAPTRSDTNEPIQAQKLAKGWKFQKKKYKEEDLYYVCSENKGADQLHIYCEADQHLCFGTCKLFVFS